MYFNISRVGWTCCLLIYSVSESVCEVFLISCIRWKLKCEYQWKAFVFIPCLFHTICCSKYVIIRNSYILASLIWMNDKYNLLRIENVRTLAICTIPGIIDVLLTHQTWHCYYIIIFKKYAQYTVKHIAFVNIWCSLCWNF